MRAIIDSQVWKYGAREDFPLYDDEENVHFYFQSRRDFADTAESVALVIKDVIDLMGSESDYIYNWDPKFVRYMAKKSDNFTAKRGAGSANFILKLFSDYKNSSVVYLKRDIEVPLGSSDNDIVELVCAKYHNATVIR